MEKFQTIVTEEVRRRGRVTFAEYMNWALAHPRHGYYTAGPGRTGRGGDFFTSVQAGGLFGALLTETFCEMWDHLGSERLTLVELGGGDGALAEQVLKALEAKGRAVGVSYYLIEISSQRRDEARRRLSRFRGVRVVESLEAFEHVAGVEGVVFSNEFFDALPVHRVVGTAGGIQELFVTETKGWLGEVPGEPSTPRLAEALSEVGVTLAPGQEGEVCLAAEAVLDRVDAILSRGFLLTVDYGEAAADLYRPSRRKGTLVTSADHTPGEDPFDDVGRRDITARVDFTRLVRLGERRGLRPLVWVSQGSFLLNSGEALLRQWVEEKPGDRARTAAIQQLVHPESMGGKFQVLVQGKSVAEPNLSGGRFNRIGRLAAGEGGRVS
jgi:SAM-dependent MidA family methyltransferase